tara:strand:- start:73 stop:417 length:345 start_codon:yes stop_codon:yes gene_type:complete
MAGSLSHPNKIKDVYKNLVFYKDSDSKFYRDNGTTDVELNLGGGHAGINNSLAWLKFTTTSVVNSGSLFELNNNSANVFKIDTNGTLTLKNQGSEPTAIEGGLYYRNGNLYLGI